jgi:hypothetical protein
MPGMDQYNNCAYEIWRRGQEQGVNVILAKSSHHTEKKTHQFYCSSFFQKMSTYLGKKVVTAPAAVQP